jgi:hypothetical protein
MSRATASSGAFRLWGLLSNPVWPVIAFVLAAYVTWHYLEHHRRGQSAHVEEPREPQSIPSDSGVKRVQTSDIGHGVIIVGRLGEPMDEGITIRGEWVTYPPPSPDSSLLPKDPRLSLVVTDVNGKPLVEPVTFDQRDVHRIGYHLDGEPVPKVAELWELNGAEMGGYTGYPSKLFSNREMVPQGVGSGFRTQFHYKSSRVLGKHDEAKRPTDDR